MAKIKTYVIFIGRKFPNFHLRKGEETDFVGKIHRGEKTLTIRDDYDTWRMRVEDVNEGKAVISLRYWIGRPYHTTPQVLRVITAKDNPGCHKFKLVGSDVWINGLPLLSNTELQSLLVRDGLNYHDFMGYHLFGNNNLVPKALIYFNDFRF